MIQPVTSRLRIRVQPNASRLEIAGWHGDALRVRTTAPPAAGKANQAVSRMLAQALGVPQRDVNVVRGHGSRDKIVEIIGIDEPELLRLVERLIAVRAPSAPS